MRKKRTRHNGQSASVMAVRGRPRFPARLGDAGLIRSVLRIIRNDIIHEILVFHTEGSGFAVGKDHGGLYVFIDRKGNQRGTFALSVCSRTGHGRGCGAVIAICRVLIINYVNCSEEGERDG